MADSKFHAFDRGDTTYTSNDLSIGVSVFVPKSVEKGQTLPVLIRWHGGALINGGRVYEPWFPRWIIELAALHSAIIVAPDYRLLPESSGLDILSDLHNFYSWLHGHLGSFVRTSFPEQTSTPDLSNILITGESAGGYMAVQSTLLGETKGVKAVIAHYPMIDLKDSWYSKPGRKVIWGQPPPSYPDGWLDQQLEIAKSAKPTTERIPKDGEPDLFVASLLEGRYTEILGTDTRLFPLEKLRSLQQRDGTLKFVRDARGGVKETIVPGAEHGFDNDSVTLETDWVMEGRKWLKMYWP
ncbi:alpha/beta-hydrolase, partial [Aureobasidium melanogenum]